ncbi:MAG: hypothetical protein ACODAU_13550 [Myxococcota bacterium]
MTSTAGAHLGHVVVRAERYLKVEVGPERVRVVVSMTLGPGEAARVLAAADSEGDGDGRVSAAEAQAYLERWAKGLREELPMELDGERVEPEWGDGYLAPLGPVRPAPGAVEMVARVPLDGGRHVLTVRDRMRPEVADRTDVAFRALGQARLHATGLSEEPANLVRDLAYGPRLASEGRADAITAVFEVPGLPRTARWGLIAAASVLLALGGAAWWAVRRRRRPGRQA